MSTPDTRLAEVLRLALVEGQSVRAISRGLSMSRRTGSESWRSCRRKGRRQVTN